MRLIDKGDTSLAIALLAGTVVIFERPLRQLFETAHAVEARYQIDLIPGLAVLVGTFAFHQFRKRQHEKHAGVAARAEVIRTNQRAAELERLVAFSAALSAATDDNGLRRVFQRFMPAFARGRDVWMLTRQGDNWEASVRESEAHGRETSALEHIANSAVDTVGQRPAAFYTSGPHDTATSHTTRAEGVLVDDDVCFPMTVGDKTLGVVGVRSGPPLTDRERRALGAAMAILATAIRNVQLLTHTRENSVRDPLTACFNRAYAIETLGNELQRAKRTGRPLSVMMFDIDSFKRTNDEHGHLAGDAMIASVADQCARTLRASDIKCRWGGDEFLIILPDTPLAGAEHAGGSLTRDVASLRLTTSGGVVSPTISVGVAVADPSADDPMSLVARADEALYRAKRGGRNQFVVATLNERATRLSA